MLLATVLILMIASANLAGLLALIWAAAAGDRRRVPRCGARRSRIVTLLLIESAMLALVGGAFGILVAQWGIDLFAGRLGSLGQGWLTFGIDGRDLLFAFGASLATALLFGLLRLSGRPAWISGVLLEDVRGRAQPSWPSPACHSRRHADGCVDGSIAAASSIVLSSEAFETLGPGFARDARCSPRRACWYGLRQLGGSDRPCRSRMNASGPAPSPASSATSHLPLANRNVPRSRVEPEGTNPRCPAIRQPALRRRRLSWHRTSSSPARPILLGCRGRRSRTPLASSMKRFAPILAGSGSAGQRLRVPIRPTAARRSRSSASLETSRSATRATILEPNLLPLAHSRDISFVVRALTMPRRS